MTEGVVRLRIGPVSFVLSADPGGPPRYDRWPYADFVRSDSDPEPPAAEIRVRVHAGIPPPPGGAPVFKAGRNWTAWRDGEGWCFAAGGGGQRRVRALCRVDAAFSRAELHVDGDPADAPLRYPLDQVLTWGLLARCGGLLLHAAAVARDGSGVALAGRSGAGKSTLAGLCAESGWTVLNDDRAIVHPAGGGWRIAGTPWPGSGLRARNVSAPLRAVYVLQQDRADAAEAMTASGAVEALLPATAVPWFDDTATRAALEAMDRLIAAVPIRRFRFTRAPSAVRALAADGPV